MSAREVASIKKKLDLLQAARARIESKSSIYICLALAEAADNLGDEYSVAMLDLIEYVRKSLDGSNFLDGWIRRNSTVRPCSMWAHRGRRMMHHTRLAWLDWMIACYEEDLTDMEKP